MSKCDVRYLMAIKHKGKIHGLLIQAIVFLICLTINLEGKAIENTNIKDSLSVLFNLNFDDGFEGKVSHAKYFNNSLLAPKLVSGIKGNAAIFSNGQSLRYFSEGNINKAEGTIAVWVKLESIKHSKYAIPFTLFEEDGTGEKGSNCIRIEISDRKIQFNLNDPDDSYISHKHNWRQGEWHHLAITWNANKGALLYLDGIFVDMIKRNIHWTPVIHEHFFIGDSNDERELSCEPVIDEFSIYNKELYEDEVRSVFLEHGVYHAELSIVDPLLIENEPDSICIALNNPGEKDIIIKNISLVLNSRKAPNQQKELQDQIIKKLSHKFLKVPMTIPSVGNYELTLNYNENGHRKEVTLLVHVLPKYNKKEENSGNYVFVKEIDAVSSNLIAANGETHIVSSPVGEYREAGSKLNDRFAIGFEVEDLNEPHLAVISYPDDKPRSMEILLQQFDVTKSDKQANAGVMMGEEYSLSNKMQEGQITFWPRSKKQAFIFMTTENGYPAAVKNIKIYKIRDFKVVTQTGKFVGSVPSRSTGLYYEDPVLFKTLGTNSDLDGFSKATDRLISYMQSFGQTELEYPLVWYNGPLYGTLVEPFQPNINGRPHPEGFPSYILKRFGEQNMKFTAGLHIHKLPSLYKYALADTVQINRGKETIINIDKEGRLLQGNRHGADPNFNAADPKVMKAVTNIVREICERYAQEPAFNGVSLTMARPKIFTFGSLESGYNDINLKRFQEETHIKIPGYIVGDAKRFDNSYKWLMANSEAKKAWVDWRCNVLYRHYVNLSQIMASYRPDIKLKLNIFVHLTNNERMADYLSAPPADLIREIGIDPSLYKGHSNIVLSYTIVPSDFRWKRSNRYSRFPPANAEVDRTVMTAPEVVASLKELSNIEVTIFDRYWESAVGRTNPLEGLKKLGISENDWRVSTLNPVEPHSLEPYVFALNNLDATSIVKGGYSIGTFLMENELENFTKAFDALPAVKFQDVPDISDPVRIRQKVIDGKLYFYVLNILPEPVNLKLSFKQSADFWEPVENKYYATKVKHLKIKLKPYDLRVFTSSLADLNISSHQINVPQDWLNKLSISLKNLDFAAESKNLDNAKYAKYLSLARDCWEKKHYARLYFLLQEDWVKEIERSTTSDIFSK